MMHVNKLTRLGLIALTLTAAGACSKSEETKTEDTSESKAKPATTEAATTKAPALQKNATVVEHLAKIVAGCEVTVPSGLAYKCKNKEDNTLREWVRKEAPADLFDTLVAVAGESDEKMGAAAVAMMASLFTVKDDAWKKKNATPAAATALLEYVKNSTDAKGSKMAPYAAHLAFMNDKDKELFAVVEGHKDSGVKIAAYQNYMTHGRLRGFEELKRITQENKDPKVVKAALRAPRNMYKDTDAEKAAYCPWAEAYLEDQNLDIVSAAGYVMVKCRDKYIDRLLEEGEKRQKGGEFKRPFSQVFREPCFQFIKNVTDKAAAEDQCEKVYSFLQGVADDEKVEPDIRGISLWNIYYQRRDQKTLDLMRKYEKHKVKEIADKAQDAIKSLTTTYKLK